MLSTDEVVHGLYASPPVIEAVCERWGEEVRVDGRVDRARVAARAFAQADERAWLENLLWPLVGERVAAFRVEAEARRPQPVAIVIETPLLFEAGMDRAYDATIAVVADDALRSERAAARGHASVAEREQRQLSQAEKARRATFVVRNSGGVQELEDKLSRVLADLQR
ncbi:MAG: hypothetical protein NVSMB51_15280 [Solirubrobacteraceae bacterium]